MITPPLSEEWVEFIIFPNLDFFRTSTDVVCLDSVKWELQITPHDPEHCLNWSVNRGPLNALTDANANADTAVASLTTNYQVEFDSESIKLELCVDYFTDSAFAAVMDVGHE